MWTGKSDKSEEFRFELQSNQRYQQSEESDELEELGVDI